MNIKNCLRQQRVWTLLALLLATVAFSSACSDPEQAKAEHLSQGEAYLKEKKFQEASIEFRNAARAMGGYMASEN
jgi:UDP-glucose 6-dehydrogenase